MSEAIITLIMQVKTGEFRGRDNSEVQWEPGGGALLRGGWEAAGKRRLAPACYFQEPANVTILILQLVSKRGAQTTSSEFNLKSS